LIAIDCLPHQVSARAKLKVHVEADAAWRQRCSAARGAKSLCPVFPIGDALLEPFWPQVNVIVNVNVNANVNVNVNTWMTGAVLAAGVGLESGLPQRTGCGMVHV
jgi:hypothetical protein